MASPPHPLALALAPALLLLLSAAALFLALRSRGRSRLSKPPPQLQQLPEPAAAAAAAAAAAEEEEEETVPDLEEEETVPDLEEEETVPDLEEENVPDLEEEPADEGGKEKRRRRKARRRQRKGEEGGGEGEGEALLRRPRFPLASVAGALQRRITDRYDDLARASNAESLTIDQVREFINCLVDARNELLHKSEIAQRSFMIKKALLANPCSRRGSYDRLFEQVNKLEAEHKRLKDDADIYDNLQEQLQMSPSYKHLLELNAEVEKKARERALAAEAPEISFEELLAQEKSDAAFWQRHRKLTSISPK